MFIGKSLGASLPQLGMLTLCRALFQVGRHSAPGCVPCLLRYPTHTHD